MTTVPSKTQIQRLRRAAKKLASDSGLSHLAALHKLATERGYADWSQFVRTKKATLASAAAPEAVSPRFAPLYEQAIAQLGLRNPPSLQEVVEAMQEGLANYGCESGRAASDESAMPSKSADSGAARSVAAMIVWTMFKGEDRVIEAVLRHVSTDMTSVYLRDVPSKAETQVRIRNLLRGQPTMTRAAFIHPSGSCGHVTRCPAPSIPCCVCCPARQLS